MTTATHQKQVSGDLAGEARPKAGFWSLTLGCIGVVYGDIGTSPLYAVRESVVAAVGTAYVVPLTIIILIAVHPRVARRFPAQSFLYRRGQIQGRGLPVLSG